MSLTIKGIIAEYFGSAITLIAPFCLLFASESSSDKSNEAIQISESPSMIEVKYLNFYLHVASTVLVIATFNWLIVKLGRPNAYLATLLSQMPLPIYLVLASMSYSEWSNHNIVIVAAAIYAAIILVQFKLFAYAYKDKARIN